LSAALAVAEVAAALARGAVDVSALTQEGALLCAALAAHPAAAPLTRALVWVTPTEEEAARAAAALRALLGPGAALALPDPPSPFAPARAPAAVEGARLHALTLLARGEWVGGEGRRAALCLSALSLAHLAPPPAALAARALALRVGDELSRDALTDALARLGYTPAEQRVEACGEFRLQGDRLDLYPPHLSRPLRLSFWGDALESIHPFHPQTQRATGAPLHALTLTPARLLARRPRDLREAGSGLRNLLDDLLDEGGAAAAELPEALVDDWVRRLDEGLPPPGVDALGARLLNDAGVSLHALLTAAAPEGLCCVLEDPPRALAVLAARDAAWGEERAACLRDARLAAPLREHLLRAEEVAAQWGFGDAPPRGGVRALRLTRGDLRAATVRLSPPPHLALRAALDAARGGAAPLAPLLEQVARWVEDGYPVVVACASESQRARLARLLAPLAPALSADPPADLLLGALAPGLHLALGAVSSGFTLSAPRAVLLAGGEALGQGGQLHARDWEAAGAAAGEAAGEASAGAGAGEGAGEGEGDARGLSSFLSAADELNEGDLVVHERFGVAVYRRLDQVTNRFDPHHPFTVDCLRLEFAKGAALLLPVYDLHLIQRFVGVPNPRLASLSDPAAWDEAKLKARREAEEQADAFLELYAERAGLQGVAFSPPDDRFAAFEAAFPHVETPDQERAVRKILKEMCAPAPMDHLLCGDVGFGKTEVAMRAAMKALLDGRQVAVLVPTTLLAAQHTRTFRARFKDTPFRVEQLSRFVTPERALRVREALADGAVHVIIGTQSLLQDGVRIPHLGLLVLDEEHRFGVRDKERLRALRANLDVLSMTATPIPRTLQMSLTGIRSLSLLATPPRDRQSVYTQVSRLAKPLVREAILAELGRGGQVFYVHNRVETIATRREWLQAVVPEATIAVAHGGLRAEELEEVMHRFTEGAAQVLLCTTIIETGLDIPRANTLLVEDAHRFGLSQLYQLRGRVGRSHERARCYLLLPPSLPLSPEAQERLEALQRFTDLGSGFHVASRDLELRGAGQLLGTRQNGHSEQIGLELYQQLLRAALDERRGRQEAARLTPVISLPQARVEALSPAYIPSPRERLSLHRRLAQCATPEALDALRAELVDRFGDPARVDAAGAPALDALFARWRIELLARLVGAVELAAERRAVLLRLHPESRLSPAALARAAHLLGGRLRAEGTAAGGAAWRYALSAEEVAREDLVGVSCALLTRLADQLP